jgi:hypothetical protein
MCWRPRELSYESSVAHLVRSLRTYARIRSLTTGTFNQIFKDRITIRLSGAHSVRTDSCENPSVLETLQPYCAAKNPVNRGIPQNFHLFSTVGISMWGQPPSAVRSSEARQHGHSSTQQYGLPPTRNPEMALTGACFFGRAKAEDRKLIKELALEVLTLKAPFRNLQPSIWHSEHSEETAFP